MIHRTLIGGGLPIACLFAGLCLPGPAHGVDRNGAALDNSAALSSGAIVSTIRSGGAIWYNPAGLGGNTRDKLDVSLSAFVLRDRSAEGAIKGRLAEGLEASSDLDSLELASVPSALVFSRRIDDRITLGLGVFVPKLDISRVSATTPIRAPGIDYVQRGQFSRHIQRYAVGPAVGWAVTPRLRLGASLFGIYETDSASGRIWSRLDVDTIEDIEGPATTLLVDAESNIDRFGFQPVAGVQYTPVDGVHLGLTVRAPIVRLKGLAKGESLIQATAYDAPTVSAFEPDLTDDEGFGLMAPGSVHGGVSVPVAGGALAVAVELQMGLEDPEAEQSFDPVWNVQLGGLWPMSETWAIGAGLFTDHSALSKADELWEERVDFYGVTGGVRLRDPLTLSGGGELIFETTIGVRYAIGFGEVGGVALDFLSEGLLTGLEVDVVHHTASLHVGSALLF